MGIDKLQFLNEAFLIFQKDVLQEFKTRYAVNAILLFAVVTLVSVSFSIGTFSASAEIKCALLWIILFFSAMSGLSHIFIREEEKHTADTLKLVALPISIFLGKFFFNLLLFLALQIIIIPLFFVVMNFSVEGLTSLLLILIVGGIGLSAGSTLIAAIISKANARGALFTVLAFPILLPVIVAGISGTKIAVTKNMIGAVGDELQMLFAYAVVVITGAVLLFDFVWKE
jgi:heme exporter protein B